MHPDVTPERIPLVLRALINGASEWSEKVFARDGAISPHWFGITETGDDVILPMPPGVDKDIGAAVVRMIFKEQNVVFCLLVDEAWIVEAKDQAGIAALNKWSEEHDGISGHPDRIEIIMFSAESISGSMMTGRRKINRNNDGATLGELEIDELRGGESHGRFVGMLGGGDKSKAH